MEQLSFIPFGGLTITIYNKYQYKDSTGRFMTKWIRRVIRGCSRADSGGYVQVGTTKITSDSMVVIMPLFAEFLEAFDWNNLPNEELQSKFTANEGDLIVLRDVSDEVDPDLETIDDIADKYGSLAFKIAKVSLNYGVGYPLPHIEVSS